MSIMLNQLSVLVENKIGSLSKVTHILSENNINIRAIASFDSPEFTIMRMLVDDEQKAKDMLLKAGFMARLSEVLAVEIKDEPGSLDNILDIIASENLCLDYIYSFVYRDGKPPLMIIHVDDMDKAKKLLASHNIKVAD